LTFIAFIIAGHPSGLGNQRGSTGIRGKRPYYLL
jgi:hypothetical protein